MSLFKEKMELKIEEAEFATNQALGSFSPFTKWLVIFFLLGSVPVFFLAKSLAFSYRTDQLKKFEITAKPPFTIHSDLVFSQPQLVSYPDGSFGAATQLTNPNSELSAQEIYYKWTYFDSSGQLIQPQNLDAAAGKTYIQAKRVKYIVAPRIISTQPIARAEINLIGEVKWQKKLKVTEVLLSVAPASTFQQISPTVFTADSTILNNSPYQIKQINLIFLVYDQTGNLKALSSRQENDLKPFERRAFKQLWPSLSLNSARVEILAETNTLDPKNLTLPAANTGASDLSRPKTNNDW